MRSRSETIGTLGRAPARAGRLPSLPPAAQTPLPAPPPPPPPEGGAVRGWIRSALFENLGLKFLSLVLAVTVSLLVNADRDREITAHVGVAYSSLPDDKVLVSERLDDVQVTIRGPWRRLRRFDERQIDRVNLDLRNKTTGELDITPDMIHLPAGLTVGTISPRSVHIAFERRVDKLVEIAPVVVGRPRHGFLVGDIKAVPATVEVRGAETTLAALTALKTREIALDDRSDSFSAETALVAPDGVEIVGSGRVQVEIHVDEELVTRHYGDIAVQLRGEVGDPLRWTIAPARVDVTLTGALLAVERARDNLVAIVKLTAADGKGKEAEVALEGLPPGVGVKVSPERVKVTPVAAH